MIGADGIHSTIRELTHGAQAARFTGCIAWRATIPTSALPPGHVRPVASNWIGAGGHFVHYYVRRGELVNCVGGQGASGVAGRILVGGGRRRHLPGRFRRLARGRAGADPGREAMLSVGPL